MLPQEHTLLVRMGTRLEDLVNVASYIYNRYYETKGEDIDEMKLHKMLYFAQRESIHQNNKPLFKETFYGWKFGPVLKEVRKMYRDKTFLDEIDEDVISRMKTVIDSVFIRYANKDSWNLTRLTYQEISWKNSRKGISKGVNGDAPIRITDIVEDAKRDKCRRNKSGQQKI